MPTVLVRSMPAAAYRKIKKMAKEENLSLSEEMIRLVLFALDEKERKEIERMENEKEKGDVFDRIDALRKKIQARNGNRKQEPAWKMIRRMRDERAKRYE